FSFVPPPGFVRFRKPLKTHLEEATFKSERRGYQIGVAVDPIKIDALSRFGTPEEVGERVVAVERAKDGTLEVRLVSAAAGDAGAAADGGGGGGDGGAVPAYTLEYAVDSTRGKNRFVAKVAVRGGRLYVCTGQAKEADLPEVAAEMAAAVGSFRLLPPP
ncbi:unnamed protein product, partial [Phaeothamnion confervicola]